MAVAKTSTKVCLACRKEKELTDFQGKSYICNDCAVVIPHEDQDQRQKICFTCLEHKPLTDFTLNWQGRLGRDNSCKECNKKDYWVKRGKFAIRYCEKCGKEISKEKKINSIYCSDKCRNKGRKRDEAKNKERKKERHEEAIARGESKACKVCG